METINRIGKRMVPNKNNEIGTTQKVQFKRGNRYAGLIPLTNRKNNVDTRRTTLQEPFACFLPVIQSFVIINVEVVRCRENKLLPVKGVEVVR